MKWNEEATFLQLLLLPHLFSFSHPQLHYVVPYFDFQHLSYPHSSLLCSYLSFPKMIEQKFFPYFSGRTSSECTTYRYEKRRRIELRKRGMEGETWKEEEIPRHSFIRDQNSMNRFRKDRTEEERR